MTLSDSAKAVIPKAGRRDEWKVGIVDRWTVGFLIAWLVYVAVFGAIFWWFGHWVGVW